MCDNEHVANASVERDDKIYQQHDIVDGDEKELEIHDPDEVTALADESDSTNEEIVDGESAVADEDNSDDDEVDVFPSGPSRIEQLAKERKRKSVVARIISIVAWTVGICLLLLCFSNLYQQVFNPDGYTGFFGIGEAVVSSNSMEPKLYTNDLIFYRAAQMSEIEVGDTIIYKKSDSMGNTMLIVHQVEEIGNGYVTTKGLNNSVADDPISISAIVGEYMFKVSQAGIILNALQSKWAPAIIILMMLAFLGIRIGIYCLRKKTLIDKMTSNSDTKNALDHFFDI